MGAPSYRAAKRRLRSSLLRELARDTGPWVRDVHPSNAADNRVDDRAPRWVLMMYEYRAWAPPFLFKKHAHGAQEQRGWRTDGPIASLPWRHLDPLGGLFGYRWPSSSDGPGSHAPPVAGFS